MRAGCARPRVAGSRIGWRRGHLEGVAAREWAEEARGLRDRLRERAADALEERAAAVEIGGPDHNNADSTQADVSEKAKN